MLILLNHPLVTLFLLSLLLLLIKSNNNKYGISLSHRGYHLLVAKNSNKSMQVIDIRDKSRFDECHAAESAHHESIDFKYDTNNKLVIIHDSDISLAQFFSENKLKCFSDDIYQTNMLDYNFKQYQPTSLGIFKGSALSALIKNKESI